MAEAHSAVAFSFTVTPEGVSVDINRQALKAVANSGLRYWKKRIARYINSFHNQIYPFHPSSWFIFVMGVFAASYFGFDVSKHIIKGTEQFFRDYCVMKNYRVSACLAFSCMLWTGGVLANKLLLRFLLSYQGWMHANPHRPNFILKVWLILLKLSRSRRQRLYGYQYTLPNLPLPKVKDTLQRYLRSVKPLLTPEQFANVERKAEDFCSGPGRKLQLFLWLKSLISSNYVSDWWEDYVYLANRAPLMANSNYYGMDILTTPFPKPTQAARAGLITYLLMQVRREIDCETRPPLFLRGLIPLCSWQYERQFNTTRIPMPEKDVIVHWTSSYHISVYHKGRYFKCPLMHQGRQLLPAELEIMFQSILDETSLPAPGEEHLAAMTASPRDIWAATRATYLASDINRKTLEAVEKGAFFLVLDDDNYDLDSLCPTEISKFARSMLLGNGGNRWFDKSFACVVTANAKIGTNNEHSWADAPVMAQLFESVIWREFWANDEKIPNLHYLATGHCHGEPGLIVQPIRLVWSLNEECQAIISSSLAQARQLADDIDLFVQPHLTFGKSFSKAAKISPDAFVQIAMQLAYYRDTGSFCLTYEAAMTRLFREGRTETVRTCTLETCDFVLAMVDPKVSVDEKKAKLKIASETLQKMCRDAMTGKGVDRHLFALYVVSKYLRMESPFLKEILSEPWRLSTSQTPMEQSTDRRPPSGHPVLRFQPGGGFGPVADDGYGVSYIFSGDDAIFFHISSRHSSSLTSSKRFAKSIVESLSLIRQLVTPEWKVEHTE